MEDKLSSNEEMSPIEANVMNLESRNSGSIPPMPYDIKQDQFDNSDLKNARYEEQNKMYICHLCDFRTAFRNSLLNHQAVHSDFRPWVCARCDYAAKRKQDLKKHLHTIHGLMVESTMLKPIVSLASGNGNVSQALVTKADGSGVGDSSWDCSGMMKMSEMESVLLKAGLPQTLDPSYLTQPTLSNPNLSIKQERKDPESPPPSQERRHLPDMSNFVQKSSSLRDQDSPDFDLPISFPPQPAPDFSSNRLSEPYHLSGADAKETVSRRSPEHLGKPLHHKHDRKMPLNYSNSKQPENMIPIAYDTSTPVSSSSLQHPPRKRSHGREELSAAHDWASPLTKTSRKSLDSDDSQFPCSSSNVTNVSHVRGSQTQVTFMCEHCDIMFFQRAMYLMHMGLHSAENPWRCTVCGCSFTEKYSFTSHFINQH